MEASRVELPTDVKATQLVPKDTAVVQRVPTDISVPARASLDLAPSMKAPMDLATGVRQIRTPSPGLPPAPSLTIARAAAGTLARCERTGPVGAAARSHIGAR